MSEEAQAILVRGFAAGRTAAFLAQAVRDATNEVVAERTVSRRAAEWRAAKDRFERAKEKYRAIKETGFEGGQLIQALAFMQLEDNPDSLTGADPVKFHALGLEAEKIALKKREIEVRERAMALEERKVTALESREQRAREALQEKGEEITPEMRVEKVRQILGLA